MLIRILLLQLCCISSGFLPVTVAQATDDGVKLTITPRGPLEKPVGENMFLRCLLEPEAAKGAVENIRWLGPAGDLIVGATRESDRIYTKITDSAQTQLYITKMVREDAGEYSCVADFPGHPQLKTSVILNLFQGIKFEDAPAEQHPISGTDGKIKCEVSANPAPDVEWLRDGEPIAVGGRYKIDTNGLAISGITQEDDGEYTCRAVVAETGGLDSRKIKVEVYSRPEFQESSDIQNPRGIEQRTISLPCAAIGRPAPSITWTYVLTGENVLLVEDEQRTHHHTVDPVTGTMTINDLQKRHQGEYRCTAENPAGIVTKASHLFVAERPRFDILTNATESEGTSATLHCTVRGDPAATLRYVKEGNLSPFRPGGDPRITVVENERDLKVTINQLTREDDGLYVCIAENEAGVEEKSSHITVKFKPSFRTTPMNVAKTWLANPVAVNLTCLAESIPNATLRWEKKERNVLTGAPFLMITPQMTHIKVEERGPSGSILITPRNKEDFGEYECVAKNELGEVRHTIMLHQASYPGPISLVEFAEVTATSIRFNLDGPHEPNNLDLLGYQVYYHEAGVEDMSHAQQRKWTIGMPYTLDNLKPSHRYVFRFYAENAIGLSQETRDFERTMPDVGPPRPPGFIPPSNDTLEANRYRLQWQEPEDNGARIIDYQIKYWKDGENERPVFKTVPAPTSFMLLTGLHPSTRYHYELTARNERGVGPALNGTFTTANAGSVAERAQSVSLIPPENYGVLMSTPVIIGVAIGALFLLLLFIDLCLYCTARRGLTAFICRRFCGQSKNLKGDTDTEKMRTTDETSRIPDRCSSFFPQPHSSSSPEPLVTDGFLYSNGGTGTLLRHSDISSRDSGMYQVGVTRNSSMGSLQQLETDV